MIDIKGQNSLIPAILIVALTTGAFLSILFTSDEVTESINYNTGDFNTIAESKLRADAYERRTKKELNYSTNIYALNMSSESGEYLGDNSDDIRWGKNTPTMDEIIQEFLKPVEARLDSKNGVYSCAGPSIKDVEVSRESLSKFNITLQRPWITCTANTIQDHVPTKSTVNISETQQPKNTNNRYLQLAEYSIGFSHRTESRLESREPITATGDDDGDPCPEDSGKSEDEQEAIENAKSNIRDKLSDESLFGDDSSERPNWISRESSSKELDLVKVSSDGSKNVCNTYVCGENEEGDDIYCDDYDYDGDAKYAIDVAELNYTLKDSDNKVVNSEAEKERIFFYFNKIYDLETPD